MKTTLDTWNKSVADKSDAAFGRTTGMDEDLSQAPYYAIKVAPGIHHTEVTGGIHGQNRIGGNAVADIIIFGRQAGTQSAAHAK